MRRGPVLALAAALLTPACAQEGGFGRRRDRDPGFESVRASIRAANLSGHIRRLCSDFDGRRTASEGERAAAEYVAGLFREWGLTPAGESGTFLQAVPMPRGGGSRNVLAYREGSHSSLKVECVAVSSHLDAIGGFGADDNASGMATVLELARAFASLRPAPKRSVLFVVFGAEEPGMIGSAHYAKNPTVFPIERHAAVVNLDMIGRNDDASNPRVIFAGCESAEPSFEPVIRRWGADAGLRVYLEEAMLAPSGDHEPLYEAGMPFLRVYSHGYGKMHADYHRPSDTPDKLNVTALEKIARLLFAVVRDLADLPSKPRRVDGYRFVHILNRKSSRMREVAK